MQRHQRLLYQILSVIGRATQGVRLIGVSEGDQVVSIVRLEDQGDATVASDDAGAGGDAAVGGDDASSGSATTPESSADVTPAAGAGDDPVE